MTERIERTGRIARIVDFALHQRAVVLVATLLVMLVGTWSFMRLPIEAYPDVADTTVQIITQWPGHAAEEIERQISIPVERVMNGVPRQSDLRSISIAGLSVVTLVFEDGTDTVFARQQVDERLPQVELPAGASPQLGPFASPVGEIMRYRLIDCTQTDAPACTPDDREAPPRSLSELKDLQVWVVERELLAVPGVADVTDVGGTYKQYQVVIDPAALASHGLRLADVQTALERANANAGGGVVPYGEAALDVRGVGLLSPGEIATVPVAVRSGTPIRVSTIAEVQVGYQPRLGRVSVADDDDVVAGLVLLRKGEHAQEVLDRVHAALDRINAEVLPKGVKAVPYLDRTDLMKKTTTTVEENLLDGVALVTIVLFVFLGNVRAALIVAITIPLALLVAFIGMNAAKVPANLLSIGAIDFGMLVDGSIVVVENVFRRLAAEHQAGRTPSVLHVVSLGTREMARPILFAKLVVVAAYLPIFTLQRVEGRLFEPMAWTVSFALLGAVLAALTVIPVLASLLFRGRIRERRNPLMALLERVYAPTLRALVRGPRWIAPVLCVLLLGANVALASRVGTEFLPHLNEGALWVRATLPANVSLATAEQLLDGRDDDGEHVPGLREVLGAYPEVERMAVHLGRPDDGTDPTGFFNAEILLVLTDHDSWRPQLDGKLERLVDAMSDDLAAFPGVGFGFSQPISDNVEEAVSGVKGQLAIKVRGDDLQALDDLADAITDAIAPVEGVVDLGVFRELGGSNVDVQVARERAARYGLGVADVEDVVDAGIGGRVVGRIVEGERSHDLVIRYRPSAREDVDAMRRLPVPLPEGRTVPLSAVADVDIHGGATRIYREHNRRFIAIKFGVRDRDLGSTVAAAQAAVAATVKVPPGYVVSWEGEFESARRATARLEVVVPITVVAILVLLFAMFRSPRQPLLIVGVVLLTSPLGGIAALLATGTSFSVSAGVGLLALFGVSVQTGVLLVAAIDERRRTLTELEAAILDASRTRLRAVVMTALVATLGLVPAALSTGIGSDSQKPLAIVVVGGLVSSLVLSVILLPLLYRLFPGRDPASAEQE